MRFASSLYALGSHSIFVILFFSKEKNHLNQKKQETKKQPESEVVQILKKELGCKARLLFPLLLLPLLALSFHSFLLNIRPTFAGSELFQNNYQNCPKSAKTNSKKMARRVRLRNKIQGHLCK